MTQFSESKSASEYVRTLAPKGQGSPRQRLCLELWLQGKKPQEIAKELEIEVSTVRRYLTEMRGASK
jgi:DNA-binding NarL/FixJ family response regulator